MPRRPQESIRLTARLSDDPNLFVAADDEHGYIIDVTDALAERDADAATPECVCMIPPARPCPVHGQTRPPIGTYDEMTWRVEMIDGLGADPEVLMVGSEEMTRVLFLTLVRMMTRAGSKWEGESADVTLRAPSGAFAGRYRNSPRRPTT